MYGTGISREGDLIDVAVKHEIIQKSGTWFSYGDERLGQGRENVKKYLLEQTELLKKINKQVREALGMVKKPEETKPAEKKSAAGNGQPAATK